MNAIFQFENHENVARRLRQRHLLPDLTSLGIASNVIFHFQDYLNRQAPGVPVLTPAEVSDRAMQKWEFAQPQQDCMDIGLGPDCGEHARLELRPLRLASTCRKTLSPRGSAIPRTPELSHRRSNVIPRKPSPTGRYPTPRSTVM